MSMIDSIGGLSGGLGGSGGVGGSIPSNSSAASSAATATINPNVTLAGSVGGGTNLYGPFSVNFPGTETLPADAVNAPPVLSKIIPKGTGLIVAAIIGLVVLLFIVKR